MNTSLYTEMHERTKQELINFYSFFTVKYPQQLGLDWHNRAEELALLGTILVAPEGINIALCGKAENLDAFLQEKVKKYTEYNTLLLRRCTLTKPAYRKLRLKIKKEIIHSQFPLDTKYKTKPESYLSPEEFHQMAQKADFVLLDTRNRYETAIGSFKGAVPLPLDEFHQLPRYIKELEPYRHKELLTFCTGGVRCEKAVALLQQEGFRARQLQGGILHYLEKYGQQEKHLWQEECFVFDDRVSVNAKLQPGSYQWCSRCGQPSRDGACVLCDNRPGAVEK